MKKIILCSAILGIFMSNYSYAMLGSTQETQIRNTFKNQLDQLNRATSLEQTTQVYENAQKTIAQLPTAAQKNLNLQLKEAKSAADERFTRTALVGVKSENDILAQELAFAKNTIAQLTQQLEQSQKTVPQDMKYNTVKISTSELDEIEQLKKDLQEQKNLNLSIASGSQKELMLKNEKLTQESKELGIKIENQKKEIAKQQNTMLTAAEEINNIINKVEDQKNELKKLHENIDENTRESQKLVNKIGEQQHTIELQTKEITTKTEEITKLKTTYNEADKAAKDLINKTENLKKEIDDKAQKITALNIELKEKESVIQITKKLIHELGGQEGEEQLNKELQSIKLINGYMDLVAEKLETDKDLKIANTTALELSRTFKSEIVGYLPLASINSYLSILKSMGKLAIYSLRDYTTQLISLAQQTLGKKQASTVFGDYYYAKDIDPLLNEIINLKVAEHLRPLTILIPYTL